MSVKALVTKIEEYKSFQAGFYTDPTDDNYLFKVYFDDRNLYGLINLADPRVRGQIIAREYELNRLLAPAINCEVVTVQLNRRELMALRMRKLNKSDFLSVKLENKSVGNAFEQLGHNVATIHKSSCVPTANIPDSLGVHFTNLIEKDLSVIVELDSSLKELCLGLNNFVKDYVERSVIELNFRQSVLQEPRYGHGDIKVANIAIFGNAVQIMDPAPLKTWQLLDRRVDAMTLKVELESLEQYAYAKAYWDSYTKNINDYQQKVYPNIDKEMLNNSNTVIDIIGRIYYLVVLFKVSLKEANEEKAAVLAKQLQSLINKPLK